MDLLFFKIAIVLYLGAALGYLLFLMISSGAQPWIGFLLAVGGFAAHSLSILHRAIFSGFIPLATPFDVVSFFSWVIVGLFLMIRYRDPSPIFGSIVTPLAAVLLLYASTLSYQIWDNGLPDLIGKRRGIHKKYRGQWRDD